MKRTISAIIATTTLLAPVGQAQARDLRDARPPVAIVETPHDFPLVRDVEIKTERLPVVRGRATGVIVDDIRTTPSVRFAPKRTFVYVSTDPYDHMH